MRGASHQVKPRSRRSVTGANPLRVRRMGSRFGPPVGAGVYPDPGGAGIREWTGTEWSPFLRGHPVGHGSADGWDPAPGWSPLPPDVQQAQWNHAINAPEQALKLIVLWLLFGLMMAFCTVLTAVAGPDPQARAVAG